MLVAREYMSESTFPYIVLLFTCNILENNAIHIKGLQGLRRFDNLHPR